MRGDRRRALLHNRRIVDAAGIEGVVVQLGDGIFISVRPSITLSSLSALKVDCGGIARADCNSPFGCWEMAARTREPVDRVAAGLSRPCRRASPP
jgi:hypothetical protein